MTDLPGQIPDLDAPIGPLESPLRWAVDDVFEVVGRRAAASGSAEGIDAIRLGAAPVLRALRARAAGAAGAAEDATAETTETPLGVERLLGDGLVERLVVSRDAPVAWVEWTAPTGTLDLSWRASPGPLAWARDGRTLRLTREADGSRALCIFSVAPEALDVLEDGTELDIHARFSIPADGLRVAVVGVGPGDDPARLLRIAGRPMVAVRGREAAAGRVLAEGLRVTTPDPGLNEAVARAVIRHDATGIPGDAPEHATARALGRLAAGNFEPVHDYLRARADEVGDDGRLPPAHEGDRPELLFLLLAARALAWSGDIQRTRALWPAVERVLGALGAGGEAASALRTAALAAAVVAAEEIGAGEVAAGEVAAGEPTARSSPGSVVTAEDLVATLVLGTLGADPDAPRGRLALRPRIPAGWDQLEVKGLAVGSAAVDFVYRWDGGHRFRVEQTRGPAPLQLILEPELAGDGEPAARVDGEPAALDPAPANGRWRVPVQVVLDRPRTLAVEFARESV